MLVFGAKPYSSAIFFNFPFNHTEVLLRISKTKKVKGIIILTPLEVMIWPCLETGVSLGFSFGLRFSFISLFRYQVHVGFELSL